MDWTAAHAHDPDLDALLDDLVERLAAGLPQAGADLAFVFVSAEHRHGVKRIQRRLLDALQGPRLLGCTAGGVISGARELENTPAVAVLAGRLPGAGIHAFALTESSLPDPDSSPRAWHEALGVAPADAPSFVALPDPMTFPVDALLGGLDYAWPGAVTVGGLASGARRAGEQVLLLDDRVLQEGAVGVALMGDVVIRPAVAQGCRPIGRTLQVSACDGHLLTGLDGRPALDALRQTFAEAPEEDRALAGRVLLLGFETDPLAPGDDGPWLVRPLIGVDKTTQGLVVAEALRRGRRVRFHLRDRAASHDDLDRTLEAVDREPEPAAALLFSCTGRGVHLYGRPDHDAALFAERFGDVPLAGFFANGEIGPVGTRTHLHGFTSAFGLLGPRAS